ncbi:MAG TPA: folate-binding protein [Anaeromyxobacteraceae bacterium]|nr:folate-binding protein [Anaeromyxobacteraceae bacterium]
MTLDERLIAARSSAAVGPVLATGILRLRGRDSLPYLHRMCTQDVARLAPGGSAYAAFLDARGRLVGEGIVAAGEGEALLVVEPCELGPLAAHLGRYVVADDVALEDVSGELRALPVLGQGGVTRARALGPATTLVASPRRGAPAVEVLGAPGAVEEARRALVADGAVELSEEDLEILRIEEGLARFGHDMDGERLPMEAGLTSAAIHFGKGCYIGQEVVLRATMRGHLQKGLVQLALPAGAAPGSRLLSGADEVGWVTSAAETTRGRLGLGYVRRAHWREGAVLRTVAGDARVTKVIVHEPA